MISCELCVCPTTTQYIFRKSLIFYTNSKLHLEDITLLRKLIEISFGLCLRSTTKQYIFCKSLRFYTDSYSHLEDSEI